MKDLISVIIPSYNRENTILRAINSVLNQSYSNIELIVVDDCSTDATIEKLKQVKDKRFRFIKLSYNSGACFARNVGIEEAKGNYIAFQDSDDYWHRDKVEIQLDFMKRNNADVSFCNFNKIGECFEKNEEYPKGIAEGAVSYNQLLKKSLSSTQCMMVKAKCFKYVKFDNELPRLQDWDFTLELAKKFKIYHLDRVLVDVYVQQNSISKNPQKGITALQIIKSKNEDAINLDDAVKYNWYLYMGNYVLEARQNPSKYYKSALKIKYTFNIFIKYILCKAHLLIVIYRFLGKI